MRRIFSALLLFAGLASSLSAQTTSQAYRDYIEKYKDVAVRQMQTEHIPASIIRVFWNRPQGKATWP